MLHRLQYEECSSCTYDIQSSFVVFHRAWNKSKTTAAFHTHNFQIRCTMCSSFMAFHRVWSKSNTTVPLVEQKLLTLSAYKDLYLWISCCSIFRYLFWSLFLLLYFFYLAYLAIVLSVALRFLITPLNLASSSFS